MPDLLELAHIRQADVQHWGNKNSALGELLSRGFPVPEGICLSIRAFRKAGARLTVSRPLAAKLRAASAHLLSINPFLAVRSSATAEDLPDTSYAGLYQSVIGVSHPQDIGKAVEVVWRSYANPSAVAARAAAGHPNDIADGMGVLIQPVIRAEVSGVCFSVDPVQPLSDRMAISAGWGLGVGVVDGSVPTDTLWLRRDDLAVVERRIVEKDACYSLDESAGLARSNVPAARRSIACLPDAWAQRIAQFARAAEQIFAQPQDIEWAIADGQVWILQSRPIASLAATKPRPGRLFPVTWKNPADSQRSWQREHYESQGNRPLLPLEIDYIRLKKSTRLETCLLLGADYNEEILALNGWIYASPAPLPLDRAGMRVRQQAFRDLEARLARHGHTAWDHWGPEIEQANQRLSAVDTGRLDAPGLANFLEEAMAARSRHNMLHPLIWFKPRQPYFDAFQAVSGLSGTEAETAAFRLLEGEASPLTQLVDGLYRLAEAARRLPAVAAWMRQAEKPLTAHVVNEEVGFPLQTPGAAGWLEQLQAFLSEYGDRNGDGYGSEALITTPTWRDQPLRAVQMASQFLDVAEPPSQQRQRARQAVDAEVDALCARCANSQSIQEFVQELRFTRRVQAVVEVHNHHIEQIGLGQLRRAVLAAAQRLEAAGLLTHANDIFWLYFGEILAALRNPAREPLTNSVLARKEEHQAWAQYEPPPHLGLPAAALPPRPDEATTITLGTAEATGRLHGLGASAGVVQGRARVIAAGQAGPPIAPGDILVAENAGPLWLPFFPILAGIVLEGGSLGQHAASTAREYGLPAVIAVPNATQRIKNGDWIRLDGIRGSVELVEPKGDW